MTTEYNPLYNEQFGGEAHENGSQFPSEVPWHDKEAVKLLEAQLREADRIGVAKKDGGLDVHSFVEFTPEYVFTAKWNSAPIYIPTGTHAGVYEDPLPIDWSLTPNPKTRLSLTDVELHEGVMYALEGETGLIAVVTEDGLDITHVGPYQDVSDRDVSPAGKTWGKGTIAGMGPLWIEVDNWDELEGAQLNANIVGHKAAEAEGEAPHVVTIPADINKLAKHWREDLVRALREHEVFQDCKFEPGTRILFTTGLLYWEQDYEVRYFHTNQTPDIDMSVTLTLPDGRETESKLRAHTVERPQPIETEEQAGALYLWDNLKRAPNAPNRTQAASSELQTAYLRDRNSQQAPRKLERLVTPEGFSVQGNPDTEDMQILLPNIRQLHEQYQELLATWQDGAGVELTLVRSATSIPESKGELPGVLQTTDGQVLDDTLLKRSAQRAYDVGSLMWEEEAPDLVITSGRSTPAGTMHIALYGIGEPYPISAIQRDWRLNERSFGEGFGQHASNFTPDQLYSFTNAIEGGENFSYVHIKTLSFILDVLRTANHFYTATGRRMRVVVCSQEGPMQIMRAILTEQQSIDTIFEPIENTHSEKVMIHSPFAWPQYVTDDTVEQATS